MISRVAIGKVHDLTKKRQKFHKDFTQAFFSRYIFISILKLKIIILKYTKKHEHNENTLMED